MGSPKKIAPFRVNKLTLHLLCEWNGCGLVFTSIEHLNEHVGEHIDDSLAHVVVPGEFLEFTSKNFMRFWRLNCRAAVSVVSVWSCGWRRARAEASRVLPRFPHEAEEHWSPLQREGQAWSSSSNAIICQVFRWCPEFSDWTWFLQFGFKSHKHYTRATSALSLLLGWVSREST